MTVYIHEGVELDQCGRCGGTFLDSGESAQLSQGEIDPRRWAEAHYVKVIGPSQRMCLRGHGAMALHRVEEPSGAIELDLCSTCGGLFLDRDEGAKVRVLVRLLEERIARKESGVDKPGVVHYLFQLFTGFPAEVWNPVRRPPTTVYALVAILILLFGVEILLSDHMEGEWAPYGMCVPADLVHGLRPWTLLTYGFLHGSLTHLLGNLYFLWVFGDNIEDLLGPARFLMIYVLALILGGVGHVAFNLDSTLPLVGASGAIAGLMGAYLVLFPKVKLWIVLFFVRFRIGAVWYLAFWLGLQLVMAALGGEGVAWWAHIGGFVAGAGLAWRLRAPDRVAQPVRV